MSFMKRLMTRIRGWFFGHTFFGQADLFLAKARVAQPVLSPSQEQERMKHLRIQALRDRAMSSSERAQVRRMWDQF